MRKYWWGNKAISPVSQELFLGLACDTAASCPLKCDLFQIFVAYFEGRPVVFIRLSNVFRTAFSLVNTNYRFDLRLDIRRNSW